MLHHVNRLDSHHRLLIALGAAALVFGFLPQSVDLPRRIIGSWLIFSLTVLGLAWVLILQSHPLHVRRYYQLQDSSRALITLFTLVAALASLFAVVDLLRSRDGLTTEQLSFNVLLSVLSIVCSWALVHTIFTLRYAHFYYEGDQTHPARGLEFPGQDDPDYLDFAYFSFVIGMTSQVSDVGISSKPLRRLALLHGVLSYAFNAIIVALSINILSGLISK